MTRPIYRVRVRFAADCLPCPGCDEEPFCEEHQKHYGDCSCVGPDDAEGRGFRLEEKDGVTWAVKDVPIYSPACVVCSVAWFPAPSDELVLRAIYSFAEREDRLLVCPTCYQDSPGDRMSFTEALVRVSFEVDQLKDYVRGKMG